MFFVLERVVGFQAGAANSAETMQGFLAVYCFAPIIAYALTYLPLIRYPLDKTAHDEVRAQLEARTADAHS